MAENIEDGLDSLGLKEVLDADPRPTFVLDLDPDDPGSNVSTAICPVFCNAALRLHERLLDAVLGSDNGLPDDNPHHAWVTGVTTHDDSKDVFPQSFIYHDLMWTGSTVRKRWRLVSGTGLWQVDPDPPLDLASGAPLEVATGGGQASLSSKKAGSRNGPVQADRDDRRPSQAFDLSHTSLPPAGESSSSPIFYPRQPTTSGSIKTGNSKSSQNISLNLATLPERAAIDWTVPEPQGQLSTHLQYVRSVDWSATSLGPMDQWSSEFRQIANLVMTNPHPVALFWGSKLTVIYNEAYANEVAGNKHPTLMGTDFADFFAEIWDYCGPLFEECGRTGISVRKDNDFVSLYRHGMLEETYFSWTYVPVYSSSTRELSGFYNGPFQTTSMVLQARRMQTINSIGERTSAAKTVKQFWKYVLESLRENPRDVPFALLYSVGEDDDGEFSSAASETSISLKTCHFEGSLGLATSLASTILFEEETRRMRDAFEAAHLEKENLTQQLDLQASRLRRMTELSPLGMFLISPEGVLREANDTFFEMTGLPRESQSELSWMDIIMPSSIKTMEDGWHILANEHRPWSDELQLNVRHANPVNLQGDAIDYWVMFIAQPEIASDGSLRSIMGSITDISKTKWAQGLQEFQLSEAEETRRQQNEFIDITSHEMRNPLSAILQCADDITTVLAECKKKGVSPDVDTITSCLESAQTISLCVQHQKSIVDDILTVSKLDSNLLLITPIPTQPEQILSRALRMFESELQAKDIEAKFEVHPSYIENKVDWVSLDPSRVLQVLINLLTNAIKFTATSKSRRLAVAVAASREPPVLSHIKGFQFAPLTNARNLADDRNDSETLYIRFKVQDSGCGLTAEEKQILFQRFKQASPRTHAQYGGSGLGLFISKRLAELHGGQIGVASEAGEGSIFSFYVQAKRCEPPVDAGQDPILPLERHLNGDMSLQQQLAPQRQDLALSGGQGASLVVAKAVKQFDPKKTTILVVEDNLINQRVLANQLKKAGCKVNLANDGLEALEFLRSTHFCDKTKGVALDIILMDLEMPNMDGLTCVREIRKMEATGEVKGHVPVIAVTANVRDQQVATARQSGMDDVLSKPFRIPDLLKQVETLLLADSISAVHIA
ncbi:hypothetical protein M406DRAFT_90515 [Cryphonectria parasitica EP155]|uniref:Histidine kinase n=1 Tax=Cryphonectria parasitica (strain ATCC 38755 / EP155) TaxID=660469 RepID=A0A9P4Y7K1_CRYP1|nr:uncharacterized protein M406DRAFT_90515 [Cryphonectria parasitica EP155]KAF3767951.1 hypothetical protein M406DRAFT_90515 [Cryphonectria parasitica EP155]